MTHPAILIVARTIDPDSEEYGDDHERPARALETAKRVVLELANARLPYTFMHGGVKVSLDPSAVSLFRSLLLEVAK